MSLLFLGSLGGWEMVAIVFVILLLFGGKKIPELMKGLGSGIREFNNAKNAINTEIREGIRDAERKSMDEPKAIIL
ncbi:MAG: twin-arginine translocase TatA/TatE family subunit [Saprospiraceae bacterium]|nr:twin-arginine translocase TatA/TatE family subunit [Saprospiraceae bacterium]